jgi:hypothetical protein
MQSKKKNSLLEDLIFMVLIHFLLFFIYIFASTNYLNGNDASTDLLTNIMKDFKDGSKRFYDRLIVTQYEPNYPKISRIHYFPTYATEKEMAKHDRYLVHGVLYTELLNDEYLEDHWYDPDKSIIENSDFLEFKELKRRKVCINIMIRNGPLPYINALIMTLMKSHESDEELNTKLGAGHRLLSYTRLNILDTERYDRNYDDIRLKVMNLPFINLHSVQGKMSQNYVLKQFHSKRLNKIKDYIASAKLCIESDLPWCLMMEEFTVVPIDFLESLKHFVIAPLESYAKAHAYENDDPIGSFMSVLTLFSAYKETEQSVIEIHDVEYSKEKYETDRGKLNSERHNLNMDKLRREYEMYSIPNIASESIRGGFGAAMLFPLSTIKKEVLPMLESLKKDERNRVIMLKLGTKNDSEDVFDLEYEISVYTKRKRYRLEPSLVNRIGFYDDGFTQNDGREERTQQLGIENWWTDPRFVFEAGEYSEDREEWCSEEAYQDARECRDI